MSSRIHIGKHSIAARSVGVSVALQHCTKCGQDAAYPSEFEDTPCERDTDEELTDPLTAAELEQIETEIERLECKQQTEVLTEAEERALIAEIEELRTRREELAASDSNTDTTTEMAG